MVGSYYSDDKGTVDVYVQRDDRGEITSVDAFHEGDSEYDERTRRIERERSRRSDSIYIGTAYEEGIAEETVVTEYYK